MKRAYMDHAAATPVRPEVLAARLPFLAQRFGNPSAVCDLGSEIKAVMEEQRDQVARLIGARREEIIFTSSGAEANNLTIKGMSLANFQKRGRHLIVSGIEHHSGLNSARFLEKWFRLRLQGPEDFAVLGAIGIKPEVAQGSRVSTLSRDNREEEVHHVLSHLPPAIENLRSFSPVWRQKMATAAGAPR